MKWEDCGTTFQINKIFWGEECLSAYWLNSKIELGLHNEIDQSIDYCTAVVYSHYNVNLSYNACFSCKLLENLHKADFGKSVQYLHVCMLKWLSNLDHTASDERETADKLKFDDVCKDVFLFNQ